jgi:hypothetical protein
VAEVKKRIKTLQEWRDEMGIDLDATIPSLIEKYRLGETEILWDIIPFIPVDIQKPGSPTLYTVPAIRIMIGMRGSLLGKDNYVWYVITCDPIPTERELDQTIMQGMENLRMQKAQQLNGPASGFGRHSPTRKDQQ